jgi:hypothetical protein
MKKLIIIGMVIVVVFAFGVIILNSNHEEVIVNDFESCVSAGNPVMESFPRQCRDGVTNRFYVEDTTWENDGIRLAIVKETGEYACFGCNTAESGGVALCIDPVIDAIEFVDETSGRYCNNNFEVVESGIEMGEKDKNLEESNPIPSDISMPFRIEDIHPSRGDVNPLGVVRFAKDQGNIGHNGIDIPLNQDAPIYAVADGRVVRIVSAGDPWGGMGLYQILRDDGNGEGYAFIYEHIEIAEGVEVGTELKRGDIVGTKIAPAGFTLHLQYSKVFNNFEYTDKMECWPEFLSNGEKAILDSWWEDYRKSDRLISAWDSVFEEGAYPFRGLLDESKYPEGPQFCYPFGTDVR